MHSSLQIFRHKNDTFCSKFLVQQVSKSLQTDVLTKRGTHSNHLPRLTFLTSAGSPNPINPSKVATPSPPTKLRLFGLLLLLLEDRLLAEERRLGEEIPPFCTPTVRGMGKFAEGEKMECGSLLSSSLSSNMLISFFCFFGTALLASFFLAGRDDDDDNDFAGLLVLGALGGFCAAECWGEVTGEGRGIWLTTVKLLSSSSPPEEELLKRAASCWEVVVAED